MQVVGVDGWKGGWVAIALRDGRIDTAFAARQFSEVLEAFRDAAVVGVDIPIGLPPPWPRRADLSARAFIRESPSRVFPTFPRPVYEARTHYAANAEALSCTGKGVSQQSWRLGAKILDVEQHLDDRVIEVHPEISFRALVGLPLASKKTWAGHSLRRHALASAGIELPADLGAAGQVPVDDVLDAAVAAWSSHRRVRGEAGTLPEDPVRGEPRIWY